MAIMMSRKKTTGFSISLGICVTAFAPKYEATKADKEMMNRREILNFILRLY